MDSDNPSNNSNKQDPLAHLPMQPEQVISWRRHPMTQIFMQFCADFALQLRSDHSARWQAGAQLDPGREDRAAGYANALADLTLWDANTVNSFYLSDTQQQDEEENANKKPQV